MSRILLVLPLLLGGCIVYQEYELKEPRSTTLTTGVFRDLDPGAKEQSGLHFKVKAYGSVRSVQILELAEAQYQRIMNDSGLYSFQPRGLYEIAVYGSADEFHKKTQFPTWAVGLTVGNAIYAYDGPPLPAAMAHEMTHVLFHEYMRGPRTELRWINEGFAMHEEGLSTGGHVPGWPGGQEPMPFSQMMGLVPATERERQVSLWYRQVGDVVGFMILRGGRVGFGKFLEGLRERRSVDDSLRTAFPGVWNTLVDLENAWRRKIVDAGR